MKWLVRLALSVCVCALSMQAAYAALVYSPTGVTVATLSVYAEYGEGDVLFTVSSPPAGCDGLWLRPTDAGFKTLYAMVVTAYTTKQPLQVGGLDDSIWSGSNSRFCRVWSLYPHS